MSNRISLKLTDKNDWLVEAIQKEQDETNRPSFNNTVESILVSYFKAKEEKNKNVTTKLIRSSYVAMKHNVAGLDAIKALNPLPSSGLAP